MSAWETSDDLNTLKIPTDCGSGEPLKDNGIVGFNGRVAVCFRGIEQQLVESIGRAADMGFAIVGCVAWLTNVPVLRALASVRSGVSIVVQKEDFLRPDWSPRGSRRGLSATEAKLLRNIYERIPDLKDGRYCSDFLSSLSVGGDPTLESVRCMGNLNSERLPSMPRMHNKFLVFCSLGPSEYSSGYGKLIPRVVWTGSFNFTAASSASCENVLCIDDETIAAAYFSEWEQIVALSEPLDWGSEWCEPQWRIGS